MVFEENFYVYTDLIVFYVLDHLDHQYKKYLNALIQNTSHKKDKDVISERPKDRSFLS